MGITGMRRRVTRRPIPVRNGADCAIGSEIAFGENQDAPAAVHELAGEFETFAESGAHGQREHMKQGNRQRILNASEDRAEEICAWGRNSQIGERFSAHCYRRAPTQARRQRVQHESWVDVGSVVRDDQRRAFYAAEIFAPAYARPAEQKQGGANEAIKCERANPSHRPPARPARVAKDRRTAAGIGDRLSPFCFLHQLFEVGDGGSVRKIHLA